MKSLIISASLVFSSMAFAGWDEVDRQTKEANTKSEIFEMFTHYPTARGTSWIVNEESARVTAGYWKRHVTHLSLTTRKEKWNGPNNSCDENDNRQYRFLSGGSASYSDGEAIGWDVAIAECREDWDPCGEGECYDVVPKQITTRTVRKLK